MLGRPVSIIPRAPRMWGEEQKVNMPRLVFAGIQHHTTNS
jgi:hypothetical protein